MRCAWSVLSAFMNLLLGSAVGPFAHFWGPRFLRHLDSKDDASLDSSIADPCLQTEHQ